jgi:transcriptional regulator with PAS, ATPase and Fis domain
MELSVVLSDGETVLPEHISVNATATLNNLMSHEKSLKEYETQIIQHFLDKYDKDVLLVAKKLDVGKSTLYRMIQAGELKTK